MKILTGRTGKRIASHLQPTIVQLIKGGHDVPCEITKDDPLDIDLSNIPMYFSVVADETHYYIIYSLYHYYDLASFHRHDFEGILYKVNIEEYRKSLRKGLPYFGVEASAAIFHLNINFQAGPVLVFEVEADGHGIKHSNRFYRRGNNALLLAEFEMLDMRGKRFQKKMETYREWFGEWCNLPDEWTDINLENYARRRKPVILGEKINTTKGLFWHRPDILFALAEKRKVIKR